MTAKQLTDSILQFAIQGKLVPQDPNDEPASVLLDRIREEKKRLVKEGKLKKKDLEETPISEDEIPFEIPERWEWVRLGSIITYQNGYSYNSSETNKNKKGVPVIKSGNIMSLEVDIKPTNDYVENPSLKMLSSRIIKGDMLMCLSSQSDNPEPLGKTAVYKFDKYALLNQRVLKFRPYNDELTQYMYYAINSYYFWFNVSHQGGGSAQANLKLAHVLDMLIPIPPLAEQKRIVKRIDEIKHLINEYGTAYDESSKINSELPEKLKMSILQEAIMGKLGTQDPNDEPASVLLDRIREEKKQLVKAGVLKKKDLVETPIDEDEIPFEIPNNWDWLRIGDLFTISSGLGYKKDDLSIQSNKMVRVLRGGNIFFGGWLKNPDDVFISSQFVDSSLYLKKNTFITPAVSSFEHMGKTGWIKEDLNDTVVGGFVLMLNPICHDETLLQYINYVFQSAYYSKYCQSITHKSGQAFYNISRAKMLTGMIPLPPLAEQHRIVEKIEALFAEVDHIKI
jgi:type I restriction enzyme S subunit